MNLTRLNPALGALLGVTCALGACHRVTPAARIEGPAVETLSPEALQAMVRTCHRYGTAEDPRVRYTRRYCAAVDTAQASLGWGAKGASVPLPSHPFH